MDFYKYQKLMSFMQFSEEFPQEALILKDSLHLPVKFEIDGNIIKLCSPYSNPVFIDAPNKLNYHKKYFFKHSVYKELLAKAIGLKKGCERPHVLDATAGMMGDSLLMYAMGARVEICERNPVAGVLCLNSIKQFNLDIEFHYESANNIDFKGSVIYFDPMYIQKNLKTKPKKEMQIFRDIIGADTDALDMALKLQAKTQRLVIKRSIKAESIIAKPTMTFSGKSTSYDVYLDC